MVFNERVNMKRFLQLIGVTIIIGFSYYSGTAQIVRPVNDTTICVGESVILEAQTGSYMYNWSTGQLSSAISVSPAVTTTYNLRVFVPDTGTELISNGEFDLGNTGFYSEYIYCPDPVLSSASHSDNESLWMEGRYAVDSNPQAYHANFSPCSGHTGNSPDKMLIVNGAPDEDVVVWSQTITVNPNQYYAFSTWAANVHPTNPARLEFKIDGVLMGDYIEPSAGLTCNWEEFYSLWYSGTKTSIEISIVNKNLIRSGNDYALDGISFNPLVEVPDSRTVTVIEPAAIDAGSDITICGNETAGLSAAVSNQTGFLWSTSGDGTFSNPSNINSNYTPGSNDAATGSVILTATANSNSPCGAVSDFLTLNLNPVPVIGFGDNQASCGGGNVILDAGNAGSIYSWNTGETSQTIEVSTAGTYSVEVTNSFNCVETDTVYVGFYANLTIDLGPDRTVCSGNPVVLNAGISGATYLWSTGETTQEIIVYGDGNYSVTVTNSYGCNATDDINVTLVPPPVVDLGPDQVLNAGDVIRLDAGSHFFYIWDDGSRNRYLDVDKPGLYAVRVFDMNGCSAMDMVNITSAAGTVPDVTLNDTIICRDESVELYAGNDFLFNWDVDGLSSRVVVSPDSTTTYNLRVFYIDETLELVNNGDFTLGNIGFQSDYYYCSSTSSWSCRSRSSKYTVSSNTRAFGSDKSSCTGVTGNSPDNVMVVEGGSVNNTVWEQDINVDPDSYYVFSLNITNLKNDSFDDFELVVNGVVIESFSTNSPCNWDKYQRLVYSDSSSSLNVQINNTSTTGVDNAFALDGISMYKLSEIPLDVTVEVIQHVAADAGSDLAICESGTASLSGVVSNESSFIWRSLGDGFFDNTGILNPTYTPGSADILNGFIDIELSAQPIVPCVNPALDTVRVDINSNLNLNLGSDQDICQGNTISLDAGYVGASYLWNTGETTQTITVSTSGNYSVVVSDANGCSGTDDINITVHLNPIVDLGADQEECNGNNIMFDAGHPGSTYLWSTGETLQGILVTTSGNYSVVMTDANGCSAADDANATIHPNPIVNLGADQETCAGGAITFDAGNVGSTYLWNTGETTQTISVSTSGNYSVTITDANGCSATDDANATIHPNPVVDLGIDQETCAGGTITLDAGNVGSTYLWNTGETTQTITVSTSGNYSVIVTDANGCSASDDANASIHANPVVGLGIDQETCAGSTITFDAGNAGLTYLWSTGETTQAISVSTSGNYSVTVTDANGCSALDDANATINPKPTVNLGADQETCSGNAITFDAGNAGSTYLWSTGETTQAITVSTSGNYSVVVTDANGCSATDDVNATIHANPTVNLGADQETCFGNSITFNAGNAGSTYLWSTGETIQSITVSTSGNYSVTVTDANGCSALDDANATIHPNPTLDLGADQETCAGGTITFDAGNAGSTYLWNTGETTQTITVSTSGNYSVTVTDANGCSASDDANATIHANPTVNLGADQQTCSGGTITFDAGNVGATYLWNTGETTQTITVSTSGNYSVTVTDANGCSALDDANATINPKPTVNLGADQETCAGSTITFDAGNAGSTYLWNTGETTQTIIVSTSGNYSATVTDANGCSSTDDANATIHPNPTVNLGADQETCAGGTITFDAGNAGSTYLWNTGETTQTITVSTSGNYSVTITDANGCSATDDANATIHPNPTVNLGADQETCAGGTITFDAGNVGSTYLWSTGESAQTITVSTSGNYSVTVTDANGCSATDDANATIHANPTVNLGADQQTCSGNTITFDAGNAGSTYLWNTGETTQTITISTSGNYSVTVTDANGCSATDDVNATIHANPTVNLGADQQTCSGNTITFDAGNAGSTYLWNTGETTQTITISTSGNYSVTVTDANGCSATDDVNATIHANPVVDLGIDQETCSGNTITFDAGNAGSTYLWSTGETTQTITVSTSGNYSVTVTDANGCSATDDANASIHANPDVDLGIDRETCAGGTITFDAGNAGSTYLWNTGETTQTISVSTSGNYSVTITDANGCSATDDANATIHPNPTVNLGADQVTCAGGTITLDAGNAGSTYLWSTGETTQTITVSTSGNFSVTVTDANGCSASDDANATIHPNPVVDLGIDQETCAGGTITFDAGNAGSTYLWSTGETTQTISVSTLGNYSVTVTDANGCSATDDVNATIHANPTVNLGADQETCFGNSITFDAGNVGATYLWNTGETTQTITVSTSGNYSVTVTDANGCSATDDANATIHPNPTVNLGADQETCAGGTITFDAGNAGSTYLWNTGETTQTITVSTSGNFSVTVTDANDCSATDDANATIHPNPTVNLGADQVTCAGGTITFDAGNAGSTYLWSTGETTQTITVSASGNYSVVVNDANGCSASDDANATIHPNPTVNLGADQETCAGGTITFDAGNAGSTYLWSTGETTQTISVSTSGNYSVTVTDANGCSATDDVNATIHANPTVNLGADQETCFGNSITFDAGNAGSTYLWSTGETIQSITVSTSGNYSVTVTNANGCSVADDANATIHANPTVNLGADQTHCDGDFVVLDAGTQIGSYLWSTGETTQTITVSDANNYFVDFTDANGCVATDSIAVNFYPAFDFNLSYSTNLVCYGDSTYIEGPVQTGYSYQWNKDGSQLVGETNYSIKAGDTGWYTLNIINENGCLGSDSVHVEIIHLPINSLPNQIDMCFGESVMLDIGDGESFLWNDGITTQTRLAYSSGDYSVEVRDLNGCIGYDSVNVVVHDLPIVDLGPDLFICAGEELIIEAPDGYHSEWIPGGQTKEIYVYEEGEFTLKATDDFGCVGNDEIRIFVHDNPNVYLGRDTTIAEGTTLLLDAGSGYVQYEWNNQESSQFLKVDRDGEYAVNVVDMNGCRGNGKVKVAVNPVPNINLGGNAGICQGTSLMLDPGHWERYQWSTGETTRTINVNQSGNYIVSVWDVYGIMGTDTLHVEVYPSPELSLAADTLSFYKGQTVTIDAGSGYSSYYWSTGSDWRSIEVEEPGDYSVQVMNDFGCVAQSAAAVKLLQPKMVVPNVFTPNGKGPNEIFYPVFKGVVTDFELYIYSRWGEQVFELRKDVVSNNELKYDGWNGTYKGEEAEIGVYVWMIFYGGKERAHGTVTLFR